MLWRWFPDLPVTTIQYRDPILEEVCDMVRYDVSEAKRVTGFQGGYSWSELSKTELQCCEYDYELHLAEQAAQTEDPNLLAYANSDSLLDMPELVTDSESEAGQLGSTVLPQTNFDEPEWYGPPESAETTSDSASELASPASLPLQPDVPLAAAILASLAHSTNAAEASTLVQEDIDEPSAELPNTLELPNTPEEEHWALDPLEHRSKALVDITNSTRWRQLASPLPGMMEDLQDALDADFSDMPGLVTDDVSDDEVDFPSSTSPLPVLMAEL